MCTIKAISQDRYPWLMKTELPRLLRYPVKDRAFDFVSGLTKMFYYPGRFVETHYIKVEVYKGSLGLVQRLQGLGTVIKCSLSGSMKKEKEE